MDKYEEALERAKEIYNAPVATIVTRTFLEQIFPELKESEDERIRKCLVDMVKRETGFTGFPSQGQVLAYLEKQKVNTEGDFARGYDCGYECCLNSHGAEWFEKQKEQKSVTPEKDFVSKPQTSVEILRHYLVWAGNSDEEDCPYTWKTLADAIRDGIKALEEQKPAEWSEEDETCLEYALWCVTKTRCCVAKDACDLDACRCAERWLESLRSKPHWKPSEKQMKALKLAYEDAFECPEGCVPHLPLKSLYEQLKKL